jgi:tetratricopeptide (TPR) repeat protein
MARKRKRNETESSPVADSAMWRDCGILAAICLLLFSWTLGFDFSPLDDYDLVGRDDKMAYYRDIGNLGALFLKPIFTVAYYRPMLSLSFMWDAILGGGKPWMFHLTNVLLHTGASLLLYLVLRRLDMSRQAAFIWAGIFAVHPQNVHAIAWIPGRNDTLLAVFAISAMLCFMRAFEAERRLKLPWLVGHLLLYALCLLTKENSIVLPGLMVAWFWACKPNANRQRLIPVAIAWVVVTAIWWKVRSGIVIDPSKSWDVAAVAKESIGALLLYAGKTVLPIQQALQPNLQDSTFAYGIIVCIGIAAAFWRWRWRDSRIVLFAVAWIGLFLIMPVVAGATSAVGGHMEHRMYLPALGVIMLLSQLKLPCEILVEKRSPILIGIAVLALLFAAKSLWRTRLYRGQLSFAHASVIESPSVYFPHLLRGRVLRRENRIEDALADFEKAKELAPEMNGIYLSIGLLYQQIGNKDAALAAYDEGIETEPNSITSTRIYLNRGSIYYGKGDMESALANYRLAAKLRPNFAEAHYGIGLAHQRTGNTAAAIEAYQLALRHKPGYASASKKLQALLP